MATNPRFLKCLLMACTIGAFLAMVISPVAADSDSNTTIGNMTPPAIQENKMPRPFSENGTGNESFANLTGNESSRMNAEYWHLPPINLSGNASEYNLTIPDLSLPNETIGPDNPLYSLKLMFENANEALTTNNTERLHLRLQHAESRLAEANTAIQNNNADTARTALDNYNDEIDSAKGLLAEIPENSEEYAELQKTIEKLQRILDQLSTKLERISDRDAGNPDQAGTGNGAKSGNSSSPREPSLNRSASGNGISGYGNSTAPMGGENRNLREMGNTTSPNGNQGSQNAGTENSNQNGQQNEVQSQKSSGTAGPGGQVSGGQSDQRAPQQGQQGRTGGDTRNPSQNTNSGGRR